MRIGLIARCDNTGLGNQTLELAKILDPDKVLLINSAPFNRNVQYPERYSEYNSKISMGSPNTNLIAQFLNNLDVVISCETFYYPGFIKAARKRGVKTILQYNYEFLDNLADQSLALPDVLLAPSLWMIDDVKEKFGNKCRVEYLPPPTTEELFVDAKDSNIKTRHNRILHIAGKKAFADRNGTDTVIEMLKHSTADYELVIASQSDILTEVNDSRLTILKDNVLDRQDMYKNFDAMILPRRYAGLCLPMNEALLSGLPVFMTDISPNNIILPKKWVVPAKVKDQFKGRTLLDIYEADPKALAQIVDDYVNSSQTRQKKAAYKIGHKNFSANVLKAKYEKLIKSLQ